MDILVSGSLAYDRIMDFTGKFSDHIMPDKLDNINVSFTVNGMSENFGGTAGNIAYCLTRLNENPRVLATIGYDYHRYYEWFSQHKISTDDVSIIESEATASAYITTDSSDNQITGFNPGAMKFGSGFDFQGIKPSECIAIVAPGNLGDMASYTDVHKEKGIYSIFDPGQSLPVWDGPALANCISQSNMLVSNDYELSLILDKTGLTMDSLKASVETIVTTKGEQGCDIYAGSGQVVSVPVVDTDNVVDPTGAGDAFRGGLIKGLIDGVSIERACQMGTVCSHYVIQSYGTQKYSFTSDEFNKKLTESFGS